MTKLIRKYQRWALALCGVLLMLTFLGNRGNGGGGNASEHVFGYLHGKPITSDDLASARAELSILQKLHGPTDPSMPDYQIPLIGWMQYRFHAPYINNEFIQRLEDRPELFLLLRNEAREYGVQSNQFVEALLKQNFPADATESDNYLLAQTALTDFVSILERFNHQADDLKLSRPAMDHLLVNGSAQVLDKVYGDADYVALFQDRGGIFSRLGPYAGESIGINFVQFRASDYASHVPPPTTQQVREQFDKFAGAAPSNGAPGNPFGFGYRLPLRTRAQFLRVPNDSIKLAIFVAGPEGITRPQGWTLDQWWDLAGQKYYHAHLEDFSEVPADSTTKPAAPPAIKPYAKVRDEILDLLRDPLTEKLTGNVKDFINTTLNRGWQGYKQYLTATPRPATEPGTSLDAPYSSFHFLEQIAAQVHAKFNVTVETNDTYRPVPLQQLGMISGIANDQGIGFIQRQVALFSSSKDASAPQTIADVMRPSPAIQPASTDPVMFIRLSEMLPSEPATDLSAAKDDVEKDLRLAAGYALAKADADKLLTVAGQVGLAKAALAANEEVVATNPLLPLSLAPVEDAAHDPVSVVHPPFSKFEYRDRFLTGAFQLLKTYDPKSNPAPTNLIEIAPDGRLFVTQLNNVIADWTAENYYRKVLQARNLLDVELLPILARKWFDYDEVIRRTGYQPAKTSS